MKSWYLKINQLSTKVSSKGKEREGTSVIPKEMIDAADRDGRTGVDFALAIFVGSLPSVQRGVPI